MNKRLMISGLLALGTLLLSLILHLFASDFFRANSYDWLVRYVGGREAKPHKDVVMLHIDEQSLEATKNTLGNWPWPRSAYQVILEYLNTAGGIPKAILFDIFFIERDRQMGNDEAFAAGMTYDRNVIQNALLAEEVNEKRRPVAPDVARFFSLKPGNPDKLWYTPTKANILKAPLPCLRIAYDITLVDPEGERVDNFCRLQGPGEIETLATAESTMPLARKLVIANFDPDPDGIYRRGRMIFKYGDHFLPSFTVGALRAYQEKRDPNTGEFTQVPVSFLDDHRIQVGKYEIPLDDEGKYLVNYYKEGFGDDQYISMKNIFVAYEKLLAGMENDILPPDIFKDKIVIIGATAAGAHDLKNTPISGNFPGPDIHGTMISNILQGNHIIPEHGAVSFLITVFLVLLCVFAVMIPKAPWVHVFVPVSAIGLYVVLGVWIFSSTNYQSSLLLNSTCGFLATVFSFVYLSLTEGAEKRKYSKVLSNMVDPQIVKEAMNDLEALKRGEEKEITAFFSDLASFSTISEALTATDLAALLNEYLSAMTIILKQHGGTLDKYIGDAIVGIYGAPIDDPNNAVAAARASLEMKTRLAELRDYWTRENRYSEDAQRMHFRIGLNTGMAKVGFMGTDELASYTMMGDTVNLAARLEAGAKSYGVEIMISESTKDLVQEEMFLRHLDDIRVKGKNLPVSVFELICKKSEASDSLIESTELYHDAFGKYLERDFHNAVQIFEKSRQVRGRKDEAVDLLIDRCLHYIKEPPPQDWDGVFTRTSK